jgi:heme exporter protein D
MMPDLGKYAGTVLSAYGATLVLIAGLILLSLWQSRKVRRALEAQEGRTNNRG